MPNDNRYGELDSTDATVRCAGLTDEIYRILRRMARRQLHGEARVITLESSALVHEAWMRLSENGQSPAVPRHVFLAIASRVMRQVLVDYARARGRLKRQRPEADAPLSAEQTEEILSIHEALERLERAEPRKSRVVEMRFFAGCTVEETAGALGVSANTVLNDWAFARRWLQWQLRTRGRK
jgi:RNA polymerase sigma factor (TIGR02999 family)